MLLAVANLFIDVNALLVSGEKDSSKPWHRI